jgi:tetratricopeptide (TPR) repeat protein
MLRTVFATALLYLIVVRAASAQQPPPAPPPPAPTTPEQFEEAQRQYNAGVHAYQIGDYDTALTHFRAAQQAAPSPEFWFNIGRCHERLGRWAEAATAYESYLAGKPTVEDAVQIRERIADLKLRALEAQRLNAPPPAPVVIAPAPPPPPRSLRAPALALLGVGIALAAGGTGAYLSEWSEYQARKTSCMSRCSPDAVDGLRTRVQAAEVAGAVLWTLAGAALVADVTLWILDGRRHREHAARARDIAARRFDLAVHF